MTQTPPAESPEGRELLERARGEMPPDAAELLDRALAGEWLTPTQAGRVLGVHRITVHKMVKAGKIAARNKPGAGVKHPRKECKPADIVDQLLEHMIERAG